MTEKTKLLTPVGRLVQGSPTRGYDKDAEGRQIVIKSGPNAGQPGKRYFMALAVPKTDPGVQKLIDTIRATGARDFPEKHTYAEFAWKYSDGDEQPDKTGFAGNWIFKFSGGFAPQCFTAGGVSVITDPEAIKTGYFIRISGSVCGNESDLRPGVYLNPTMVELVAYGEEIHTGPDASAVFSAPAPLPPGASAVPMAPATTPAGAPVAGVPASAAPAPAPDPGILAPPAPPVTPGELGYITPDNNMHRYSELIATGWTDAQIKALPAV